MKKRDVLLLSALFTFLACGCAIVSTPNMEATVAAALAATQTAQPTSTITSTATSTRTRTPAPRPTSTPRPTRTPTWTPKPTRPPTPTPAPTATVAQVGAASVVTSTLKNGWILYQVESEGFAMALPPEWIQISLDPQAFDAALKVVGEQNPEFKQFFSSETMRSLLASGLKFYAFDLDPKALTLGLPPSTNVIKLELPFSVPLDSYVAINLKQIESIADPSVPVVHQRVDLFNVEAEEFKYKMTMAGAVGKTVSSQVVQYLLVDGQIAYVITLVCPAGLADSYVNTFTQVGKSFRLLD